MNVEQIADKCKYFFGLAGIDFGEAGIEVVINSRLRRSLGRCIYKPVYGGYLPAKIEISKRMLEQADAAYVEKVICHECAHAIAAFRTGESQGHNAYFKSVCSELGHPEVGMSTIDSFDDEKEEDGKYSVYCEKCGKIGSYQRMCKTLKLIKLDMGLCQCKKCGSTNLHYEINY